MSDFPIDALRDRKDPVTPAYLRIANEIRRVILEHKLAPGTKLPSETQLVARFDVARMTTREALRVLKNEGVVRSEQGRGVFVERAPGPRPVQMGQTTESNEGDWRERIVDALNEGVVEVSLVDDAWAAIALRLGEATSESVTAGDSGSATGAARVPVAAVSVTVESQPGRVERSTVFLRGGVEGAAVRAARAVAGARRWTISVRGADQPDAGDLCVSRIGHDDDGGALVAVRGIRAGTWPVTTTEII